MIRRICIVLLAPLLAASMCFVSSPQPAQANDYWNNYWGWYNNTYRPYYRNRYSRGYDRSYSRYGYDRYPRSDFGFRFDDDRYDRGYNRYRDRGYDRYGYRDRYDYGRQWRGYRGRRGHDDDHALRGRHNSLELGPLHFDWR